MVFSGILQISPLSSLSISPGDNNFELNINNIHHLAYVIFLSIFLNELFYFRMLLSRLIVDDSQKVRAFALISVLL